MPSNLPRVLIRLDPDQYNQLNNYASAHNQTLAEIVRDALVAQGIILPKVIKHGGDRVSDEFLARIDALTDYGRNDPTE